MSKSAKLYATLNYLGWSALSMFNELLTQSNVDLDEYKSDWTNHIDKLANIFDDEYGNVPTDIPGWFEKDEQLVSYTFERLQTANADFEQKLGIESSYIRRYLHLGILYNLLKLSTDLSEESILTETEFHDRYQENQKFIDTFISSIEDEKQSLSLAVKDMVVQENIQYIKHLIDIPMAISGVWKNELSNYLEI